MKELNQRQQEQMHNRYITQLKQELRFLWQDAHEVIESEIKDRKITQYWELYRFYRKQKEYLSLI